MNTTEQNIEATIRYPFKVDPHNPGVIRGGWFDEMGGLLVGMEAEYVANALNIYALRISEIMGRTEPKPELTPEQINYDPDDSALTPEQQAAKDDAFDFARATNLYLIEARELGSALNGNCITDLLMDRTDWSVDKCKAMGDRVVNDQSIIDLLDQEGVPAAYGDE